jgi:hypothetical protein
VAIGAVAILAPAIYIRFKPAAPPPAAAPVEQPVADTAPTAGVPHILNRVTQAHPQEGLAAHSEKPAEMDHDTYVLKRRAELSELGMQNDPQSLKTILSEMENPEPEIRQAALTAAIDYGSKDAIPALQNELNWTTDAQEKVEIQKAIDFLQLPAFGTEDTAQQTSDSPAPATN